MRILALSLLPTLLATALFASPPAFETVIVTPVSAADQQAEPASRSARIAALQDEARRSQRPIVQFLQALNEQAHGVRPVAEVHSIWLVNRMVVSATSDVVRRLVSLPAVESVRPARTMYLPAPVSERGSQPFRGKATYGLEKLRVPQAWSQFSLHGEGVKVGHLDTGADSTHPELAGKIALFKDFFGSTSETAFDGQGHGTHTAGTIVGGAASGESIGVAPGAKLISGRIFDNAGSTTDAVILRAMNWVADPDGDAATDDAPRLVSNSWGGPQENQNPGGDLWDACKRWVDLGILPVFSGGNSGPFGKVGVPGGYPHVLAVGSTNSWNWASTFSSRGPVTWEGVVYTKPDVCAPGSSIKSAKDKGGYTTMSGTSMSCPHVAGVVALMLQANPKLAVTQIVDVIRSTATDLGSSGRDNTYGWGLVDAVRSIEKARALGAFTAGE